MRRLPPNADGSPIAVNAQWAEGAQYSVYDVARPLNRVAVIGVGGGGDLLAALTAGPREVHGYELNGTFVDLLLRDFKTYNAISSRPEIRLHHTEARVGIGHSHELYDVIQASLIDTWAATASGGFVLSENGLYTREGWKTFLDHLSNTGILTATRWHIPDAPAETHRLVSLAAAALEDVGIPDAEAHIVLLLSGKDDRPTAFSRDEGRSTATILVSKAPFTGPELSRLGARTERRGTRFLAAPGMTSADPVIRALLSTAGRADAIRSSAFDISPPTDLKPYFFLQVRPSDLVNLSREVFGSVTQITFNGVRIMMIVGAFSLLFVALIAGFIVLGMPGAAASGKERRVYRLMTVYFLGIGLGYILVQMGLHQRLIIVLGHPTLALSVVLFFMLLGTSLGAGLSKRFFPTDRLSSAGLVIVGALVVLLGALQLVSAVERIDSSAVRIGLLSTAILGVGFVLGFAFPLGVRRVAPTGEWAVQKMWAMNGAASIAGSVLSALVALTWGSTAVVGAGLLSYVVAVVAGWRAESDDHERRPLTDLA